MPSFYFPISHFRTKKKSLYFVVVVFFSVFIVGEVYLLPSLLCVWSNDYDIGKCCCSCARSLVPYNLGSLFLCIFLWDIQVNSDCSCFFYTKFGYFFLRQRIYFLLCFKLVFKFWSIYVITTTIIDIINNLLWYQLLPNLKRCPHRSVFNRHPLFKKQQAFILPATVKRCAVTLSKTKTTCTVKNS